MNLRNFNHILVEKNLNSRFKIINNKDIYRWANCLQKAVKGPLDICDPRVSLWQKRSICASLLHLKSECLISLRTSSLYTAFPDDKIPMATGLGGCSALWTPGGDLALSSPQTALNPRHTWRRKPGKGQHLPKGPPLLSHCLPFPARQMEIKTVMETCSDCKSACSHCRGFSLDRCSKTEMQVNSLSCSYL